MPAQSSPQAQLTAAKLKVYQGDPLQLQLHGWNPHKPPLPHQLVGAAWLYLTPKAVIGDGCGVGKTGSALALLEFLKEKGDLSNAKGKRAVVVAPASAILGSWIADGFREFVPNMKVAYVQDMTKKKRLKVYAQDDWEVLVVSYRSVVNDLDELLKCGLDIVVYDEADALKTHSSQQSVAAKTLSESCSRAIAMTATPVSDVSLMGPYNIMAAIGITDFGARTAFERYYHVKVKEMIWIRDKLGRPMQIPTWRIASVQNGTEFKQRFNPYYLRRTRKDVGSKMPDLLTQAKLIPLTKQQQKAYDLAKDGYTQLGPNAPKKELTSAFQMMRQLCVTTAFLDDGNGPDHSSKMDWLVEQLRPGGDFADEKAVIFSQWILSIDCLERRLKEAGIGYVRITGADKQTAREEMRQKFWNDPECRVVIGTTAIERAISLQIARLQFNIDSLFNPARHEQLAGRVQRTGSQHDECWAFFLLAADTLEEKIYQKLKQKQGMADWLLDADSEVFESLTPLELYEIVRS